MQDLKNIIESLLFVAEEPLPVDKLRGIIETADTREIRAALQALAAEYAQRGGGFWLQEVAGGWQIRTRPEYHEWIKRMLQPSPQRLSKAALETLAVIAYKQPVIRADIEHIRGVDCGGVLRQLLERKLIRVLGRREIAGRPLIYATTKLFLEIFDLRDLNDLPTPKEIAEFSSKLNDATDAEATDTPGVTDPSPPATTKDRLHPEAVAESAPLPSHTAQPVAESEISAMAANVEITTGDEPVKQPMEKDTTGSTKDTGNPDGLDVSEADESGPQATMRSDDPNPSSSGDSDAAPSPPSRHSAAEPGEGPKNA